MMPILVVALSVVLKNNRHLPKASFAMGFLAFFLHLHLYVAPYAWFDWIGTAKGFEISLSGWDRAGDYPGDQACPNADLDCDQLWGLPGSTACRDDQRDLSGGIAVLHLAASACRTDLCGSCTRDSGKWRYGSRPWCWDWGRNPDSSACFGESIAERGNSGLGNDGPPEPARVSSPTWPSCPHMPCCWRVAIARWRPLC